MNKNPFVKSSALYLLATVIGQGATFAGILIFTRLMSQADYGEYSTYYAYVSIFTVLIGANLHYSLNNAYIDKKDEILEYRKSVLALSALIAASLTFFLWVVLTLVLKEIPAILLLFGALHSYSFFVVTYRTYSANMENDYKKKLWLLILPNVFQLLLPLILIAMYRTQTFYLRVLGSTLGVGIVAAVSFFEMIRWGGPLFQKEYWKYAMAISVPSILMSVSYMLMQQCDKVMITRLCGAEATAVYSALYYLGYAIIAVDQALAPVRQAWLYKQLAKDKVSSTVTVQRWYLLILAFLSVGLLMVAPEVIRLIVPRDYWQFSYVAPFVAGACSMALYRFYTELILYYKKNMILAICVLISAAINVGLNFVFIPLFGAVAAAFTTVASYLILLLLTGIVSVRCQKNVYPGKNFAVFILIMFPLLTGYYWLVDGWLLRYLVYGAVLAAMALYGLKHMDEWKQHREIE